MIPGWRCTSRGTRHPRAHTSRTLILQDLLAWRDAALTDGPSVFYWRTATGEEVDFVVELGGRLLAVEVKASDRPSPRDGAHLRSFVQEYGEAVHGCLVLHGGDALAWLAPGILAAPWWRVV